jgi:hypothetical protein
MKIVWINTIEDNYLTDDQMKECVNIERFYIRFVEMAAYESAIRERDELRQALKDRAGLSHQALSECEQILVEEQARSAKLVEALEKISAHLSTIKLINQEILEKTIADNALAEYNKG